jgi:hypothetical protein
VNDDMDNEEMNEEQREELARMVRKNNADLERLCKDLSEEQRQEIIEKLEMDKLMIGETAREIAAALESQKDLAVLRIINLVREEILEAITPLFDAHEERLRQLEAIVLGRKRAS